MKEGWNKEEGEGGYTRSKEWKKEGKREGRNENKEE